jgi:hypothetical protein
MLVGSYLDPHDLRVCTTQLCSSGAGFVAAGFTNNSTKVMLHELVACCHTSYFSLWCCRLTAGVDDAARECVERIESFLARRGTVQTIILDARLKREHATNASVYSAFHRRLQQGSSFQLSQNQGITVEWHVTAESIAQVEFLLKVDMPTDGAGVSDALLSRVLRQHLHKLDLSGTQVSDVSPLASCQSLHTLYLYNTQVSDVSALASCQCLHTLDLFCAQVSDVSALASCQSLHTLDLVGTRVTDVDALASCQSLHTLMLHSTKVSDVAALASCQSLHTLGLQFTNVSDVSALASCHSLHTLYLWNTQVSDVSALASCQSLHTLSIVCTPVRDVSALASCQSLQELYLMNTQVSDVSALASCQSLCILLGERGMVGLADVERIIQDRG